uniref:Uncharacterized protein MANES_08G152300 n=1 Tax=Rhizophora mucronata TaxID=61149 RepID=A0A2P2M7L3_RHIMU
MSDLEQFRPCEIADMYKAAPHNPLGLLPVCNQSRFILAIMVRAA